MTLFPLFYCDKNFYFLRQSRHYKKVMIQHVDLEGHSEIYLKRLSCVPSFSSIKCVPAVIFEIKFSRVLLHSANLSNILLDVVIAPRFLNNFDTFWLFQVESGFLSNSRKISSSANPNFFYGVHSKNPRKMHKNKNAPQKGFQPIVLANNVRTRTRDLE